MDIVELRRKQSIFIEDKVDNMLRSVQINPTELCNRTCSFCPRHDKKIYKNQNKHISIETIKNLCNGLKELNFNNRIGFVGFGEPLLCKNIIDSIKTVKDLIPDVKYLEVNTNGDKLTTDVIKKLFDAGCSHISISMYDSDKSEYFLSLKKDIPIEMILRHHYNHNVNYNLNIVNRSDLLKGSKNIFNNNPCYLPFYKMLVDWNGDLLLCDNNWKKDVVFGNVNKDNLKEIWYGDKINNYRNTLLKNRNIKPCMNCSVNGIFEDRGKESVKLYKRYVKS